MAPGSHQGHEASAAVVMAAADAVGEMQAVRWLLVLAEAGRAHFFFQHLGACRRRAPRSRADLKVPEDTSRRDFSGATRRSDLAPSAFAVGMPRKIVQK